MDAINDFLWSWTSVWVMCGLYGAWMFVAWARGAWRKFDARRRVKAFQSKEQRKWEGHRRDSFRRK